MFIGYFCLLVESDYISTTYISKGGDSNLELVVYNCLNLTQIGKENHNLYMYIAFCWYLFYYMVQIYYTREGPMSWDLLYGPFNWKETIGFSQILQNRATNFGRIIFYFFFSLPKFPILEFAPWNGDGYFCSWILFHLYFLHCFKFLILKFPLK